MAGRYGARELPERAYRKDRVGDQMARSSADTREHVLGVAHDLFYWQGIRATGVDRVAAEAGVAPTTLYRLFASKDDLIAAYIERAGRLYREWFDAAAAAGGADPRAQILALFDALAEQVQPQHCRGCPFLMALAEFPDPAHPAHRAAVTVKAWARDRLGQLTADLARGGRRPRADLLADQLSLIMEGTYASAQALSAGGPARHARAAAESLLDVS
jgi:AcrR family transcriptional regulator